jgi:exo-beta-1,3-glucanase (GH17 family)
MTVNLIMSLISLMAFWQGILAAVPADSRPLPDVIQANRFITYTPRSFSIVGGKVVTATEIGIREDLKLLRPSFDGVITYSSTSGIEAVPMIAHDLGYRAVIMGIWDPTSEEEIQQVFSAVKKYPTLISAVIVGNEGIFTKRYLPEDVQQTVRRLKKTCPSLAATTSEPFFLYFKKEYNDFFSSHDLLMPNVHPVFEKWFSPNDPIKGVDMVLQVAAQLSDTYHKPLIIKETGMPSGQELHGFSVERQALFWAALFKRFPFSRNQSFACFEAFDAPWKPAEMANTLPGEHANEAFWGFFSATGKRKPVVDTLPKLITY